MEMCPYCGEEVPADSAKCWKCGTELSEAAAKPPGDDEEELEVPDDDDEGATDAEGKPRPATFPCPFCEMPVPRKADRCRACGRAMRVKKRSHAATAWRAGTWVVVVGVSLAAAVAVVYVSIKHFRAGQVRNITTIKYDDLLHKVQPLTAVSSTERRREVWARDFEGKWVRWSGVVVTKDEDTLRLTISHTKEKDHADCQVDFLSESAEEVKSLKTGEPIVYSARLAGFGDNYLAFSLSEGLVEK